MACSDGGLITKQRMTRLIGELFHVPKNLREVVIYEFKQCNIITEEQNGLYRVKRINNNFDSIVKERRIRIGIF